jgi:hypothetical protein
MLETIKWDLSAAWSVMVNGTIYYTVKIERL